MATMRRDTLLKLAKAGRLVAVSGYSFDDMTGESRFSGQKPVNVLPNDGVREHKEGFYNVMEWDFTGSRTGHASVGPNGSVCLYVHSNCNHTFKILTEAEVAEAKDRLFIGVFPGGLSYSDKQVQENNAYKSLGFLAYGTLKLDLKPDCPPALARLILDDARRIQKQSGQLFNTSQTGTPVLLGGDNYPYCNDLQKAYLEATKKPLAA